MDDMPVVNDVKFCLLGDLALIVEDRTIEGDVVGLPFARPT